MGELHKLQRQNGVVSGKMGRFLLKAAPEVLLQLGRKFGENVTASVGGGILQLRQMVMVHGAGSYI